MRFKKVFFIIPNLKGFYGWPKYPHPGVGYVSTFLETNGINYEVMDMNLGYKLKEVKRKIQTFAPELIALTLYTYKHLLTYRLITELKKDFDLPIVVGGPHVSLFKAKVLKDNLVDFAIKHEGEKAFFELCSGKPLGDIPNLIYLDNGNPKENPTSDFNENLDDLPFPKYSQFELNRYGAKEIGIVSSRGCPYQCIYCPVMTTMGRNFRPRSPENVLAEIIYWHEKGYRNFEFVDDAFLQDHIRIYKICDLIEKAGINDLYLSCSQGIRANKINRPLLERMRAVGFRCLGFGVESASDKILKSVKKGQTFSQIDEGVRIACELGYDVRLFFMVGFPGETSEDVEQSFKFALKYPVTSANFYNIVPYPGTELFNYLEKNKLFLADPDVYLNKVITRTRKPVFQIASMSLAERKTLLNRGYKISRQISRQHRIKEYKKLGVIGVILAWFLTSPLFFNHLGKITRWRIRNRLMKIFCRRLLVFSNQSQIAR